MNLTRLTCEYAVSPLGIDVREPRLSWVMESERRGARQEAYRVRVASERAILENGGADLWDSGRVESDQSVHVAYAGAPLASRMRCWWAVTVWGTEGAGEVESAPAWWEMGLLDEADWEAHWVNAPETDIDGAPLLRRGFRLDAPVIRARVYVASAAYHELYVNGQRVGGDVLNPPFTAYDRRVLYVTHDVTDQLNAGDNALGLMVGNGFYYSQPRDAWYFERAPWRERCRVMARLEVETADGGSLTLVTDGSWKAAAGPVTYTGIRVGESYDARKELPGWSAPGFDDGAWAPAAICPAPGGALHAMSGPPCRVMQNVEPTAVHEVKPGVFVVDMGQNMAGWTELTVTGPAGTEITLRHSENLGEDGDIDQANIAPHVYHDRFQTDTYTLKGDGVEVWEPRFVYHGFRYVQVTGFPGTPTPANFQGRVVHTAFPPAGRFESSNELLNGIQQCARWSYISNFVGIPTDCPHREKNGWTGDAHLATEQGLFNFGGAGAYTKWLDDLGDAQRPSGQMPGIVPTTGWGFQWGNGPAWDSALVLIPWYLYLHEGDIRIMERHYARMKRYVDYMSSMATDGIADFGLGDWCPPEGDCSGHECPTGVTGTGYYHAGALVVSRAADMLGYTEDALRYAGLAEEIKRAFNARFVDAATGCVADGGQTSQACALYQGLVDGEVKERVAARLLAAVKEHGDHVWCGILGAKYLLHALTDTGHADTAYAVASQRTFPSWGHWLEQGATTLWEMWNGKESRNHIMFGDISAWFYRALAGIAPDPDEPGFRHVIIRPHPVGDLTWAAAEHRGPYGIVRSAWRIEHGRFLLDVTVPPNSCATVWLPVPEGAPVEADGAEPVGSEPGWAAYRAVAGMWHMRVGEKIE